MSEAISEKTAETLFLGQTQLLRTIDATREMLIQHLGSSANVVFDCSQVEDADISIVQVLLSARATADRLGTTLHLRNPSPALLAVMERAGVAGVADDPFWTGDAP